MKHIKKTYVFSLRSCCTSPYGLCLRVIKHWSEKSIYYHSGDKRHQNTYAFEPFYVGQHYVSKSSQTAIQNSEIPWREASLTFSNSRYNTTSIPLKYSGDSMTQHKIYKWSEWDLNNDHVNSYHAIKFMHKYNCFLVRNNFTTSFTNCNENHDAIVIKL